MSAKGEKTVPRWEIRRVTAYRLVKVTTSRGTAGGEPVEVLYGRPGTRQDAADLRDEIDRECRRAARERE